MTLRLGILPDYYLAAKNPYFGETIRSAKNEKKVGGSLKGLYHVNSEPADRRQGSCGGGGGTDVTDEDRKQFLQILLGSGKYVLDALGNLIRKSE